jgi:hypothetical protein
VARRVRCRLGRPDARGRGDILDFGNGGSNVAISFSAALLVFTVLVTAAGWLLPSRVLSGVLVGTISAVGNLVILVALGFVARWRRRSTVSTACGRSSFTARPRQTPRGSAWWPSPQRRRRRAGRE